LAIAAQLANEVHDNETLVIGMDLMEGAHSAENIKASIERVLSSYQSFVSKIKGLIHFSLNLFCFKGIICDERSGLVRLFGQLEMDDIREK
jgi:hypothetical protein